ncbi:MAG: ADP-ribosylglycohydrolase family protein [Gammaproteobacteria bacterium]|nr:ADP-ribosylglycohydrolase family protein [Gammaproteobacteria bacterium]
MTASNSESFETGALMAVNLGGEAGTIGAIYGQLAGAHHGETALPFHWIKSLAYFHVFIYSRTNWLRFIRECQDINNWVILVDAS